LLSRTLDDHKDKKEGRKKNLFELNLVEITIKASRMEENNIA
jgi:hypothetical protein